MTATAKTQSRLLTQLLKQQFKLSNERPSDKKLQDLYQTVCKQEPNNLKLLEFLMLSIDRKLLTNSHGLKTFSEIFQQFTHKPIQSQSISLTLNNSSINSEEQKKFHRQKFLKLWPELAKKTHPGDDTAYEKIYYLRLAANELDENRMRIDDNVKKLITKENIKCLLGYEEYFKQIFTIYMPQNHNKNMRFSWNQLRLLNKRLPILCCFRFLYDAQISPGTLSTGSFFEIICKSLPPSNSNHRQILFYNSETINSYVRDHLSAESIKLLEGDVGLSFYEFELIILRLGIQINRQLALKGDVAGILKKFLEQMVGVNYMREMSGEPKSHKTAFIKKVKSYWTKDQNSEKDLSFLELEKKQTSVFIKVSPSARLLSSQCDITTKNPLTKDIEDYKRILNMETPSISDPILIEKQNQGVYNMSQKCIVIGEQLPKIVQKVRIQPRQNKKPVDELLGQKPEIPVDKVESHVYFKQMLNPSVKPMKNNTFYPILLSETVSPKDLIQTAQLYVETAFINLYEHNYETSKQHLQKAKNIQKTLSIQNKIFFLYVEGQISEAMGEDQKALDLYFKCLDVIQVHSIKDSVSQRLKALPYSGIGGCLYHASQYQYATRCYLKAKQFHKIGTNTQQFADLLNNLGCCYLKLERSIEARRGFEQSYRILSELLGVYHERTLVVLQNLNKAKKCYIERIPEYKNMWKTFTRKAGLPLLKKKK